MNSTVVSVSIPEALLADIDALAKREVRSRSELLRDAVRLYLRNQRQWRDIFALGDRQRKRLGLTEADVEEAIRAVRKHRQKERAETCD